MIISITLFVCGPSKSEGPVWENSATVTGKKAMIPRQLELGLEM
jgi:hypothetical protein